MKRGETGRKGEEEAEKHLQEKGFCILKRNFKNKYAEIDIIAQDKKEKEGLVFVEVRSTSVDYFGTPEETISKKKIRKLKQNALAYVTFEKHNGPYRIDIICVSFYENGELKSINHYENITN